MSAKHTPGPWRFYTEPQPNGCPIVGTKGLMVAMLAHSINHEDQREQAIANASLIASAPDLLEALKEARRWIGGGDMSDGMAREIWTPAYAATVDMVDAAIAKATGQKGSYE